MTATAATAPGLPFEDHMTLADADWIIRRIATFGHDRAVIGLMFQGMEPDFLHAFLKRNIHMATLAQESWERRHA